MPKAVYLTLDLTPLKATYLNPDFVVLIEDKPNGIGCQIMLANGVGIVCNVRDAQAVRDILWPTEERLSSRQPTS